MNDTVKQQDLTVEDKLRSLYELQKIDTSIDKIRILRGELPLEVQDLEDEVAGLETRIENIKNDLGDLEKTTVSKKLEIRKTEDSIKKYTEQLDHVRNNREYDALTKEIEYQRSDIELQEKRIHKAQDTKNELETTLENAIHLLEEKQSDLQVKKAELDGIILQTQSEESELIAKSEQFSQDIDERLLAGYHRIRSNARNGLAVVTIDRDSCGGCFNRIPPQRQLDIRSRTKVITCEYCGRILIDKYICDTDGSQQLADIQAATVAAPKRRLAPRKTAAAKTATVDKEGLDLIEE